MSLLKQLFLAICLFLVVAFTGSFDGIKADPLSPTDKVINWVAVFAMQPDLRLWGRERTEFHLVTVFAAVAAGRESADSGTDPGAGADEQIAAFSGRTVAIVA